MTAPGRGPVRRLRAIALLVPRSLRQHALATAVTAVSVALATGLVMAVFAIERQSRAAFAGGPVGFDAVLGARGSKLQLVLNTVFHLETSPGNIPWTMVQAIREDPLVELAIPYAVGDNYRGFRIVGTSEEIFTKFEYVKGRKLSFLPGGRAFDPRRREAVVGSFAAARTGLTLGSKFLPYHGLFFDERAERHEEYVVVGVCEPTNSPSDRVIWIPLEGVFRMGGHVLRGTGTEFAPEAGRPIPDAHKEVSAVMLKLAGPLAGFDLEQRINRRGRDATLAWPIGAVMAELFEKIGWMSRILQLVAILVCVVAAGAILASVYNTMNERRREFAILRALGATRATVSAVVVIEAGAIAAVGAVLGFVVYAGIGAAAAAVIRRETGVVVDLLAVNPALWWTPLGAVCVGAAAGMVPALKAYATDVATHLSPTT